MSWTRHSVQHNSSPPLTTSALRDIVPNIQNRPKSRSKILGAFVQVRGWLDTWKPHDPSMTKRAVVLSSPCGPSPNGSSSRKRFPRLRLSWELARLHNDGSRLGHRPRASDLVGLGHHLCDDLRRGGVRDLRNFDVFDGGARRYAALSKSRLNQKKHLI